MNSIGTDAQTAFTDIAYLYWIFSSSALNSAAPGFYGYLKSGNWSAAANALVNSGNPRLVDDGKWLQTILSGMNALKNPAACQSD